MKNFGYYVLGIALGVLLGAACNAAFAKDESKVDSKEKRFVELFTICSNGNQASQSCVLGKTAFSIDFGDRAVHEEKVKYFQALYPDMLIVAFALNLQSAGLPQKELMVRMNNCWENWAFPDYCYETQFNVANKEAK